MPKTFEVFGAYCDYFQVLSKFVFAKIYAYSLIMTSISPTLILVLIVCYFAFLILVSYLTSKDNDNAGFFAANRKSPWWLIAFGMIGTSISGVTFISVPGYVNSSAMSYMEVAFGYLVGYLVIALILLPMYYRLHLISIYSYLGKRFGATSYKTGSAFFILSRVVGSSLRLFLMTKVIHSFVIEPLFHLPFFVTAAIIVALIWTYTFKGGVKTIIWTDTFQTFFLVASLILTIVLIAQQLHLNVGGIIATVKNDPRSQIFFFEGGWGDSKNFFKQFISGAFIAIVMSGLDQDIMQKILTVKNIHGAQINIFSYSTVLVGINFLFLSLGILLFTFAFQNHIDIPNKLITVYTNGVGVLKSVPDTDLLFPTIALQHSPAIVGVLFILGITAASYASADSALTSLTTVFCIDFLGFEKSDVNSTRNANTRHYVHIGFSTLFFVLVLFFQAFAGGEVIKLVFDSASITYGPLLGLFAFGFYTRRKIFDALSIYVCLTSTLLTISIYFYNSYFGNLILGYKFGFELLLINGMFTYLGLWLISQKDSAFQKL